MNIFILFFQFFVIFIKISLILLNNKKIIFIKNGYTSLGDEVLSDQHSERKAVAVVVAPILPELITLLG